MTAKQGKPVSEEISKEVLTVMKGYFDALFAVDKEYSKLIESETDFDLKKPTAEKMKAYKKYWDHGSDKWQPSGVGWPSDEDWSQTTEWRVTEIGKDKYRADYYDSLHNNNAYLVKKTKEGFKISDFIDD